jgi:nucleoid-associated protein YgaU
LATVSVIEDAVLIRTYDKRCNSFAEVNVGSAQQSILGIFCIVAAFVLGHYIRTHPSPTSLELERQQQAALAPTPQFAIRTGDSTGKLLSTQTAPRLPAPSAGFPTATGNAETKPVANPTIVKRVEPIAKIEQYVPTERKIDVPDFSRLAASFENTPLALPRSTAQAPARRAPIATHTGSFYIRPAAESQPRETRAPVAASPLPQNIAQQSRAGQRPLVGSMPEPVAPPAPTNIYQLRERPTSFRKEDFQPRLFSDSSRRQRNGVDVISKMPYSDEVQHQNRGKRISLAPPEPDGTFQTPEVPELDIRIPELSEPIRAPENRLATYNADHAKNQIHSYYDVDMTESSRSVLDRRDFERSVSRSSAEPRTNRRIPFGLNAQGKRELTRIQNRQQQSNIDLQTERFSLHTTQSGDTLQSLSTEYYGKPDFYLDIYLANQRTLRNPAVIPAGIQLRIPQYD